MSRAYGTVVDIRNPMVAQEAAEQRLYGGRSVLSLPGEVPTVGTLYRVEAVSYAAIQPYACAYSGEGAWYTTDPKLEVHAYAVRRWTEHGATLAWSERAGWRDKWVDLRPDAKQWASRSVAEAVEQLGLRRKRQIYILQKQLDRAQRELRLTQPDALSLGAPQVPTIEQRPY